MCCWLALACPFCCVGCLTLKYSSFCPHSVPSRITKRKICQVTILELFSTWWIFLCLSKNITRYIFFLLLLLRLGHCAAIRKRYTSAAFFSPGCPPQPTRQALSVHVWIEPREPIFISVRAHKCRAKRNILLASIDINVLPQIILVYNSCVCAGGRVKARPCHSSLMDVYWKSFPPSDKGNFATAFYTTRAPVRYWKIYFHWRASAHPLEKLLGVKRDLIYL